MDHVNATPYDDGAQSMSPKPATHELPICASEVIFRALRGRWALTILKVLAQSQSRHFSALLRSVPGISPKVLTEQLRFLEKAGVLDRSSQSSRREVHYGLTARGRALKVALDGLDDLANRWTHL
jgi:DNA-binding HxlR family transcriptional regulator